MVWQPVVVGVDSSEASQRAVTVGWAVAQTAGASFQCVHAVRDLWAALRDLSETAAATVGGSPLPVLPSHDDPLTERRHEEIATRLLAHLPPEAAGHLRIVTGRPAAALAHVAGEAEAELAVIGGKHHPGLGRWVIGSTAHSLVRRLQCPLLVVGDAPATVSRVMAAVDLSEAAPGILDVAQRYAALFEAALAAIHVIEELPAPDGATAPGIEPAEFARISREILANSIWPALTLPHAETLVRQGPRLETLRKEIEDWKPDLVVVGSHGKGFDDRVLLGGLTEALLNDLPASLLVVPVD